MIIFYYIFSIYRLSSFIILAIAANFSNLWRKLGLRCDKCNFELLSDKTNNRLKAVQVFTCWSPL